MRKFLSMMVLAVALLMCRGESEAQVQDIRNFDDASPQQIVDGIANKIVRGVANIGTGWLEFPKQIYLTYKEEGVVKGMTVGPIKGVGMTLIRTVAGAGEVLTFFVAYPGFFDPYFDPTYVWEKE